METANQSDQQDQVETKATVEQNKHIETWKIKRLIQKLETTKGNGTSMVTLVIPPKDDINRSTKMLTQELSQAQNIKSRVTRQSVITAITSTKESNIFSLPSI
jgi:peptide chain release factor subunit 1